MRVVLDTNVVISGFLWRGAPYHVLKAASNGAFESFVSLELLDELEKALSYKKLLPLLKKSGFTPKQLCNVYETFAQIITPSISRSTIVAADPSDDIVVLTAIGAQAAVIITGNAHLLDLKNYGDTSIATPSDFLRIL